MVQKQFCSSCQILKSSDDFTKEFTVLGKLKGCSFFCDSCRNIGINYRNQTKQNCSEKQATWITQRVKTYNTTAEWHGYGFWITFDDVYNVLQHYAFRCSACPSTVDLCMNSLKGKGIAFTPWGWQLLCHPCLMENKLFYTDFREDKGLAACKVSQNAGIAYFGREMYDEILHHISTKLTQK